MKRALFTYAGVDELRKIQEENEVLPYLLEETLETLKETPDICVDITALVYYVINHSVKWHDALDELGRIPEETLVIVEGSAIVNALTLFSLVFSDGTPFLIKKKRLKMRKRFFHHLENRCLLMIILRTYQKLLSSPRSILFRLRLFPKHLETQRAILIGLIKRIN